MKSIIVASDLSNRSRAALTRSVTLAASLGARLQIVHVVDGAMPTETAAKVKQDAETELSEQVKDDAKGRILDHKISVLIGDPIEEINAIVQNSDADLLVVGIHRRRVFMDQIRETTMEHLVRSSRLPVLLVVRDAEQDYAHVLGGVDLSSICAGALRKAYQIAPNAKWTLFHAHEVSFRQEAERDYATWKALSDLPPNLPAPVFVETSASDAVHDLMEKGDYDLLAIGAYTRSNIGRYVLGGFTSSLVRRPPCDLLVAP
ncbi:universal stress protein [Roseovarius phycicola]|uniref:Universal stress protein n=1 Tax=Roseovarius phycicola TaxID=3080976 RepID=A0ABZ2HI54_9RHOB